MINTHYFLVKFYGMFEIFQGFYLFHISDGFYHSASWLKSSKKILDIKIKTHLVIRSFLEKI